MRNRSQKGFAGSGRCCELHEVPQHEEQWRCLRPSGYIFSDGLAEIIQGHAQALIKLYFRLPAEDGASLGDVGTALFGVILRESFVANLAAGPRDRDNALAHSRMVNSSGLPMLTGWCSSDFERRMK